MTGGPAVGRLILVDEELRIGSAEEGDGTLGGDGKLSDSHALLTCDAGGQWVVRDLGSSQGTFLNGHAIFGLEPIHRGDVLRVGGSRLLVVEGFPRPLGARVAEPPPPPPPPPRPAAPAPAPLRPPLHPERIDDPVVRAPEPKFAYELEPKRPDPEPPKPPESPTFVPGL